LFLQLLLVFLAMLALLRPGWRGEKVSGDRFIFLIDNSASMQATDAEASRLEEAKRKAGAMIDQMNSGDVAMIVSFSDSARVKQMFTPNRRRLGNALEAIQPTCRPTSVSEALNVSAGRANPGHSANPDDVQDQNILVADPIPATLFIFSDGKFPDASDFRLGNLDPVYVPIGTLEPSNVAILALSVRPSEVNPTLAQAYARLKNFGPQPVTVDLELRVDGALKNADRMPIPAGGTEGLIFPLGAIESGVLELRITNADDLACDNVAWAVVNPTRRCKVLVVTPGNEVLDWALGTEAVLEIADVSFAAPDALKQKKVLRQTTIGAYDLVIYDRCQPPEMPQANTLFIGTLPLPRGGDDGEEESAEEPGEGQRRAKRDWIAGPKVRVPVIIDTDPSHPLMQWIDLGNVEVLEGTPLEPPQGGRVLIDSHAGPLFAIAPREAFEDAVLGFALLEVAAGDGGAMETYVRTNWPIRPSFPVFVLNLLHYFGRSEAVSGGALQTGQSVPLRSPAPEKPLEVITPSGQTVQLDQGEAGKFTFTDTSELGIYEVRLAGRTLQHFAVNLFHAPESDIGRSPDIKIGRGEAIEAETSGQETTRRELWKALLLVSLAVLCIEWYVYNRRVYL
jgi:hypothetical protein